MITGVLRMTSSMALQFIIRKFLPPDIYSRQTAANTVMRVTAIGYWISRNYGYARILCDFNRGDSAGCVTPEPKFREEWDSVIGLILSEDVIRIFTVGPKSLKGTVYGVHSEHRIMPL